MLIIKKILSKKIIFPGNLFSQSLRSGRSNLNNSGFSLIELMVAVVILAIAILGIFHAYSVGFMGMADARDRTEAVNYIQKALEDYKNTPFKKIKDESMKSIQDTKFSIGSVVVDISEPDEETRLKKIITQVRWPDRNGQIKIEESSTLIYSTQKTGVTLSASDIILYASPYFRILPETYTTLTAEILDENGNIVTDWSGFINFTITEPSEPPLGYLSTNSKAASGGAASVTYNSYAESIGTETIQASADLDGDTTDDVFDSIEIIISEGAEGIVLVPVSESSLIGSSVDVNLYVVDASFDYELDSGSHIKPYDGQITLNISGPGTLSTTTISAPEGTANFTVNSNGTPGTVEITASSPDLDLGYAEVTFTGGAQSIRLTSEAEDTPIYEEESATITITILDVNDEPTPLNGTVTLSGGPFTEGEQNTEITFSGVESVNISRTFTETATITATGVTDGGIVLNSDTITINVLTSLQPAYIRLSAIPSSVKAGGTADDYSKITATVYDAENNVVTNYSGTITFYTSLPGSFLDDDNDNVTDDLVSDSITLTPSDEGSCFLYLYSTSAGNTTITAEPSDFASYLDPVGGVSVEFYSEASGLRVSASKSTVVANGIDFTDITVEIIDNSIPAFVVYDYSGDISLTTDKGYFEGEAGPGTITLSFAKEGSKSIKLYSNSGVSEVATITAEANETDAGFIATASTTVTYTEPQEKNITYVENSVESYNHYTLIKFDIQVTGEDVDLSSMLISWLADTDLDKIEIMSPKSSENYNPIKDTNGVSSPYDYLNINTTLYYADPGLSTIRLTFSGNNKMKNQNINITFYEDETHYYPIQVYVPQ